MATKDNNPGLLAKVAKFVRHPTKDWSDLDNPEPPPENGYTKQALKEMIERKRQNDFVRRREFDHLRKLRRNGPVTPIDQAGGRPSFFQSSLASNVDERAMTIKKIDEIEAQMSKQWWKGKQDEASVQSGLVPPARPSPVVEALATANQDDRDGENGFEPTQPAEPPTSADPMPAADYEPTQMGNSLATVAGDTHVAPSLVAGRRPGSRNFEAGPSEYSSDNLFAVALHDDVNDPDLEEAAIRFANGDDAGAETGLLAALKSAQSSPDAMDAWAAALFDLYRGTGQQARFDRLTLDYTERSGRPAPLWFSTPELLGQSPLAHLPDAAAAVGPARDAVWLSPATLDFAAIQTLRLYLADAPMPWRMDWHALIDVTPEAGRELASLLADWCMHPVQLHFDGVDVLEMLWRSCTPSGDRSIEKFWWRLRLDTLRILLLQDEFELAALDYCVTYELSPPTWQRPRCEHVRDIETVGAKPSGATSSLAGDATDGGRSTTSPGHATVVELTGEVLGDAGDVLSGLQAGRRAEQFTVSCSRLIRVDFSAAGSILNWVTVRAEEGCEIQFTDVPRLVAAFFNVIGINEHARIVLRSC